MEYKRTIGFQSALLVSWGVIGLSFVGAILMWWLALPGVGALLLAVSVTGLVSRLWGLYALRNLEAVVTPEKEVLSVGDSTLVHYSVLNNKALPLIWLEVLHDVPPRGCLSPVDGFVRRSFPQEEAERCGRAEAYLRRLAFLPGYGSLEWDTEWSGVCRGIYRPQDLVLRSGDGFGLTQSSGEAVGLRGRTLVIWPRIVPVSTEPFTRYIWSGTAGMLGWTEDPTVMRSERAYLPGDPWKRIDWRTAARTDELMVRQYETIRPMSILFILDSASLHDAEEGISILASAIFALSREGVRCGLALPGTGSRPPYVLRADASEDSMGECLFALSEFDAESAGDKFDNAAILTAAAGTGQTWIVTQSIGQMRCAPLAGLLGNPHFLLAGAENTANSCTFGSLRKKEASE